MMKNLKLITIVWVLFLFLSCQHGIQKGQAISRNHINYIRSLGLLSDNERIILFDSQYKIRVSGNFFTDRRIAAYWTDEQDPAKSYINYALYPGIDSIKTNYNIKAKGYISYLEVFASGGRKFRVLVKADSAETKYFFDSAVAAWEKSRLTGHH